MGKSKPRNRQRNRQDPTSKAAKPPSDPELASIRKQRILPVLKNLTSADLETRSSAAKAIANLIEDSKCRKLLLREKIVQILFEQTLTDSSLETRTSGWGILRNLALEEEADFCIHLYRQDVLTAIEGTIKTVIQTIESTEVPFSNLPKSHQDLAWNLTSSLISLLSSLLEAQDEIVEAISKLPTILNFLFGLLAFELTPPEVSNEVLSCLTTLTEDNKPTVQQIVDNGDWVKGLMQLKDSKTTLAVTACGTLHNIFSTMVWSDHDRPIDGASDAALLPPLVHYMETSIATSTKNLKGINGNTTHSTPDEILQLALEITASIATSLQEALEHGHEKEFEGFDDPINADDIEADTGGADDVGEGEEDDHEMNDDEIAADMDLVTGDGDDDDEPSDEPTLELLIRTATPKILALAAGITRNDIIRDCAISTLNNIAWTVSSIDFSNSHLDGIQKYWSTMAQTIWSATVSPVLASETADIELASTITSLAWALSRSVKGVVKLKPEEPRKFMALYQASKNMDQPEADPKDSDVFQGLGVKCIGILGSLAVDPAPVELNREIGVFLVTTLAALPETPAVDTVEALNQIFDIYSDKSYAFDEPVFWGNGFYKHLEDILPKARKLAKSIDKRKFEELRARADEAVLNFARFLKYKETEKENVDA